MINVLDNRIILLCSFIALMANVYNLVRQVDQDINDTKKLTNIHVDLPGE